MYLEVMWHIYTHVQDAVSFNYAGKVGLLATWLCT